MTEVAFLMCRLNTTLFQKITVWVPSHIGFIPRLMSIALTPPPTHPHINVWEWNYHDYSVKLIHPHKSTNCLELLNLIAVFPVFFLFCFSVCISIYKKVECIIANKRKQNGGENELRLCSKNNVPPKKVHNRLQCKHSIDTVETDNSLRGSYTNIHTTLK